MLLVIVVVMDLIFLPSANVGSPAPPGSLLETEESTHVRFVGDVLRKRLSGSGRI